jgi:hypothetical protein
MKILTKGIVTGLLTGAVILGSLPALAEPCGPPLGGWQMNREPRILHGGPPVPLTPGEFRHLEHQQRRIRLAQARMRADGHLDRWERARLHRMENRANWDLYRSQHDPNWRPVWR